MNNTNMDTNKKIRGFYIKDGRWFTVANEIGRYIVSMGKEHKLGSFGNDLSYHFGCQFNKSLTASLEKSVSSVSYTIDSYLKLIDNNRNKLIIQLLLDEQIINPACVTSNSDIKALDIYDVSAVSAILSRYDLEFDTTILDSIYYFDFNPDTMRIYAPNSDYSEENRLFAV